MALQGKKKEKQIRLHSPRFSSVSRRELFEFFNYFELLNTYDWIWVLRASNIYLKFVLNFFNWFAQYYIFFLNYRFWIFLKLVKFISMYYRKFWCISWKVPRASEKCMSPEFKKRIFRMKIRSPILEMLWISDSVESRILGIIELRPPGSSRLEYQIHWWKFSCICNSIIWYLNYEHYPQMYK